MMNDLKQNYLNILAKKGLNESEFGRMMGVSPQYLYSTFKGNPSVKKLQKIAAALEVEVAELIYQPTPNMVQEAGEAYQVTKPNDDMTLEEYKEAMATQKELIMLQKEKILNLEKELKACQDSNRVYPR